LIICLYNRQHTAVKIAPKYSGPCVHVLDASKSVVVCSSLLSTEVLGQKEEFLDFVKEDYEDIRADYFENLKEKKYLSLADARAKKYQIDWTKFEPRNFYKTKKKIIRIFRFKYVILKMCLISWAVRR